MSQVEKPDCVADRALPCVITIQREAFGELLRQRYLQSVVVRVEVVAVDRNAVGPAALTVADERITRAIPCGRASRQLTTVVAREIRCIARPARWRDARNRLPIDSSYAVICSRCY